MYINLTIELVRHRISQRELAKRIGISESGFSRKMNKANPWLLSEALKIAAILDCPVEYLFAWEDEIGDKKEE